MSPRYLSEVVATEALVRHWMFLTLAGPVSEWPHHASSSYARECRD
jgi:hypothetical protein